MGTPRPRILVVDDEEAILETMTFTFEDDYEVHTSSDARRALELLEEHAPFAVGGDEIDFVTLRLRTDDGIEGIAYAGFASTVLTRALKATVDGLCGAAIGLDAMNTEAVGARLLRLGGGGSPAGLVRDHLVKGLVCIH